MQHDFMISSLVSLIFHNNFCGYWIVVSSPKHLPSGVPFRSRALRDAQYGIPTSTISTAASSTKLRLENLGPYSISSPPKNRPGKKTSHFKGLQIYESWHFTLSYEVKDMVRIPHQSNLAISTYFRTFPSSHPEAFLGCASSMLAKIKKTYSPKQWWFDVDLPVKSLKKKQPSTKPKINMTMENPSHEWRYHISPIEKKHVDFSTPFQQIQDLTRGIRSRALGRSSSLRGDKPNSFPKRRKGLGVPDPRGDSRNGWRGETRWDPPPKKNGKKNGKKNKGNTRNEWNEWNENKPQEMRGSHQ